MQKTPVVLIIRDGWGENHNASHDSFNAVKLAQTPVARSLSAQWPRTEIAACGLDVGLPHGIMGNSEVGHQNIGAGRIVDQELVRIDKAFATGDVLARPVLAEAIRRERAGGKLHLFGLVSDAGVHSMLEHFNALIQIARKQGLQRVYLHAFTDGRDTPPFSGMNFILQAEAMMRRAGVGEIASVGGRYWAMDRDLRWDRVQRAYNAITGQNVERVAASAAEALQHYYENPSEATMKGDEFVPPTQIVRPCGAPVAVVDDGDAVLFFNYRGDRPRELTRAFHEASFRGFNRGRKRDVYFITMTEYQSGLCENILFPKPEKMPQILGEVVSQLGIRQFRTAETEKFPHVTFFFNDYREEPFPGEDRRIIPSPKEVSTYDQKPEMSAAGVCAAAKEAILSRNYGLIVVNFANPDMVGHTGVLAACIKACEVVDACVGELLAAVDAVGGCAVVTADHGNSDQLIDPETGGAHTSHTLNPVEVVIYGAGLSELKLKQSGRLGDIAPTVLKLMGIPQPPAMTGECLICS